MKFIYLYYATGTILVLFTLVLTILSNISIENMIVFAIAGFLLIVLGNVQQINLLNEKYHQLKIKLGTHPSLL